MRELWSLRLVALTGVLMITLALVFACNQNPSATPAPTETESPEINPPALTQEPPTEPEPAVDDPVAQGRRVYERERCSRCHSIAGVGSTRNPLDGVGSRRSESELVDWIIAPASLKDEMAPSAFRTKQSFAELPAAEISALTAYLRSLD